MLPPKKRSAGLDLLNTTIEKKRREFSPEIIDNDIPGSTLSQEELVSQDMSLGNVSAATLDLLYTSSTEKDAIEFQQSGAKKEIEKQKKIAEIDANPILSKVKEKVGEAKTIELDDNNKRLDELEENTIWGKIKKGASSITESILSPLPNKIGMTALFVDEFIKDKPFTGLTAKEQKEYEKRQVTKKQELVPVLNQVFEENKAKEQELVRKASELNAKKRKEDAQPVFLPDGTVGPKADNSGQYTPTKEEVNYNTAANHYAEINEQINDYVSGDTGFWSGLGTTKRDLGTIGISSLKNDVRTLEVKKKADRIEKEKQANRNLPGYIPTEQLDESEVEVLKAFATKQNVQRMNLMQGKRLYNLGVGVGGSLVMAEGMLLTQGIGGAIESGVGKFVAKEAIDLTLREAYKQGGKVLLKKLAGEVVSGAANLTGQAAVSPFAYQGMVRDNLGQAEIITDDKGQEKVLVGEGRYNFYKKDHELKMQTLTNEQLILNKKTNKTEADNERLQKINEQISTLNEEFDQLYKPHTGGESAWYGYSEYMKEAFSEKYVGDFAGKGAGKFIGKKLEGTVAEKVGKYIADSGVGKFAKKVAKGYDYSRNVVNNLPLGRISGEAIAHTGKMNLIDSAPGEVLEEIFVQLIPSYKQDYNQQLEELTNMDFYEDVIAQTLLMGVGFGGVGMAARANNFRIDKRDINRLYRGIDAAVTDEDLAQTIMMNTGNTLYSPLAYDAKISSLRAEGKNDQANKLEQTKFTNLAAHAMRTGTVSNFEETLKKVQDKSEISPETKLNIQLAQERIQDLKQVYDAHNQKPNFRNILDLAERKLANKQTINELDKFVNSTKPAAKEEIDAFIARENIKIDYSIDTLLDRQFENEEDQAKYNSFLDKLEKEELLAVQNYTLPLQIREQMQISQNQTMKRYNEEIHPRYVANMEMKKEIADTYQTMFNSIEQDNVDNDNVEFNYNNKLQETPELIDTIVDRLKAQYPEAEASVFEDLKDTRKENLQRQKKAEVQQKIELSIKDILDNREQVDRTVETPIIQNKVTVVDDASMEAHNIDITNTNSAVSGITGSYTPGENDVLFDPNEFDDLPTNKILTPQQEAALKKVVGDNVRAVENLLGRIPSFREYINHVFENLKVDKESFKPNFLGFMQGWQLNNFPTDDYVSIYDEMFDPTRESRENAYSLIQQMFEQDVPTEDTNPYVELDEQTQEIKEQVAKRETAVVGYDEENMPVSKTAVKEIDTKRTLTVVPKLGFSAIAYEEVIEDGVLIRKTVGEGLNLTETSLIDFRDLLNPNMYPTGSTLHIEVAPESMWSEITVSNGRNAEGETKTISFSKWLETNNVDRNSQEFKNKIPVFYTDANGKRLAYVQDTDWYNPYNVGNPFGDSSNPNLPTQEWLDHINEGKNSTAQLRNSIANGLTQVTITKPSDGMFYEIPLSEPKITLEQANPQTIVAVQKGEDLFIGNQIFNAGKLLNKSRDGKEGKFDLINTKGERQNGHTWEIRQIGLEQSATGEMIPTYRAYPVGRVVSDAQIETARWGMAAHLTLKKDPSWTRHLKGTLYDMTLEQAKTIQRDVNVNMGLNIENGNEIVQFIKTYFQDSVAGDSLGQYKKGLFAENVMSNMVQHTNNNLLGNRNVKSIVHIDNGSVVPLNQKYDEYLRNTLLTNIKSFDVDTTGKNPSYATAIQPVITVSYNEVTETRTPNYEARQEAAEIVKEQLRVAAPFVESKHVDFLATLGVNAEDFLPNDDMIANTEKLANIFNVSGDLNITQEKEVRQFIYNKIGNKVNFNYKNKVSNVAIKNDIQSEVNLYLNKVEAQIKPMLEEVLAQPDSAKYANLIDAYQTTLKNLNDIKANYDIIYNKAFLDIQKQTQLTLNEKEDEDIEQSDVELTVKDYNKDSIEESGKSKASYRLRRFLSEVKKYDSQGKPQTGYLGIPLYMSFNDVYNELSKTLALGSEVVSNYDAILTKMKQSTNPFIKDVLVKLETADQQIKNELVYNFVRHTLSSKFAMYEESQKGVSLKVYNTNANEVTRIINKNWRNNNKASGLYNRNQSFNAEFAQSLIDEYESWDKADYKKVPEFELRGWLGKIGLTFEDATWNQVYNEGIFNAGKQNSFSILYSQNAGGLFVPMKEWLTKATKNPQNFNFDGNENIFNDMAGVTKALSTIEAKYNPSLITLSFRDSGKNISTLVPTKYVTDMVQTLKRSLSEEGNTIIDDLQKLSLSENSIILDMLKNEPTFKGMFDISHISLTAFKERGEQPYKAGITDLSDIDYDMTGITGFQDRKIDKLPKGTKFEGINMRMANMLFPTMSDKTTGMYLQTAVFDFLKDGNIDGMFEMNEDGVVTGIGPTVKHLLFNQLVLPELKRIIKFHTQVKATNIKDYDKGAMLFHFLPIMNTLKDEDGINIIKKLALTGINIDEAIEKYQPMFEEAISGIVRKEVEFKKEAWKDYTETNSQGHTYSKMFDTKYFTEEGKNPAKDYELGVYDFVLNNLISNSEVFKVFAGDIAHYSKDKQYKENGVAVNPYDIESDQVYVSINKEIGVNLGKRLALLIAPGSKLADSYGEKYNHIFLEDSVDISENSKYLIKNYYGQEGLDKAEPLLAKYEKAQNILSAHEEGIRNLSPDRYNAVNNVVRGIRKTLANEFPAIDAYFDIESTDAQEYSTATEHISILHRIGRLSDEEFKAISTKLLTSGTAGYLTKEELKLVFQPIKPVHTGTYINTNQDVNRVVYIKSSSFPLVPQLTAGTKLDALRLKMEGLENTTGRFTRASYQTANKVGATIKTIRPFDVHSLEGIKEYGADDLNTPILVLDRNNFRIQQDVPFKSDKKQDDKVSMGTQFFKLLFGDGVIDQENFEINGKTMTGKELYNHYNKAFSDIVNSKKQELFLDLGLDKNGLATNQETFVTNLQNLLIKEASSRGYSVKSLAGLKIEKLAAAAGYYYEFKTPLWLSSDSNRYESLLNSIITNKIMKHKMPGNGFVAGSESGFKMKESLEGIDKSRIIYLDNYNGKELQGVHTTSEEGEVKFHKAQVFVPSKFKNDKKELIDLFEGFNGKEGKYITRRENGTLNLKPGMIDPALLNNFSFRTPTSSHKSGSTTEIAGILPPEMGDLMIVPKNFTKQKGLDYDIDKESAYQLNHLMTADGKIKVLEQSDINNITQGLRDKIEEFNLENISASKRTNFANDLFRAFVEGKGNLLDEESLTDLLLPQVDVIEKLKKIELQLGRKLAENEFIKSHLAVFNNPSLAIQNKINSVLSIDFAKEQAAKIEGLNAAGEKNRIIAQYKANDPALSDTRANEMYNMDQLNFTMLTNTYQKSKMNLGAIGKVAIGVYANYSTFNALLQQHQGEQIYLQNEEGYNKSVQIGHFISNGNLGAIEHVEPTGLSQTKLNEWREKYQRTIAEAFDEKINTGTDNEKEQVLGRVGVDEFTINVDALTALRGFGKDENGNSISYMLLSQPIIKELNRRRKDSKGTLGSYLKDSDLIKELLTGIMPADTTYVPDLGLVKTVGETTELIAIDGSILTGDNLLSGIKENGKNDEVQLNALLTYLDLESEARNVSKLQKVINTNVLGKSMIESQLKYGALARLADNPTMKNMHLLLGEYLETAGNRTDGYNIGNYYVVPTTPQGQIVINGLYLGNTLYQDFFPYQDESIKGVVSEILAIQGKGENISDNTIIENFEGIVEDIKKMIYSRKKNNVFNVDPRAKRYELFKDDANNTSLSTYMKDLVKNTDKQFRKGLKAVSDNALIKTFQYETGLGENELSLIKYNNTATDNLDEEQLYNAIPELVLANTALPDRNGQPYNTVLLAEDLVAYAFLQGGVQKASEFIKFVPVEFLESVGQYENVKIRDREGNVISEKQFIPANRKLQGYNTKRNSSIDLFRTVLGVKEDEMSSFTRQYFQHNPGKAPKANFKLVKNNKAQSFEYEAVDNLFPALLSLKNKKVEGDALSLYEHVGNGLYQKIDTLGTMGMSEYEYGNPKVSSIRSTTVNVTPVIAGTESILDSAQRKLVINDKTTVKNLLGQIANIDLSPEYSHLVQAANWLLPTVQDNQLLTMDNTLDAAGRVLKGTTDVIMNPNATTNISDDRTAMTFIHEVIHTITVKELAKYFDPTFQTLKPGMEVPPHVANLMIVFNDFKKQMGPELLALNQKINDKKNNLPNAEAYTERELGVVYGAKNIKEFLAVALTSPTFQEEMSKVQYKETDMTFWDKFKSIILDVLDKIYPGLKDNSVAKASIMSSMDFIKQETNLRTIETQRLIPHDIQLEMEKTNADPLKFTELDNTNEVQFNVGDNGYAEDNLITNELSNQNVLNLPDCI